MKMGLVKNIAVTVLVFYAAFAVYRILYESPPIPDIPEINYWGAGEPKPDDTTIKPFKINIPDAVLEDLKERLKMEVRLMRPLNGTNFEYGFNTGVLREFLRFWRSETKYNWRDREVRLNGLPQFTTQVFGLNLHFIHAKPKNVPPNVQVLPLLLLHGFPGTVKEFYEIIPMLIDVDKERDFVFEVIAPSLPGYAFSEAAHKPGLSPANMAAMFRHLMLRLGHEKFYVKCFGHALHDVCHTYAAHQPVPRFVDLVSVAVHGQGHRGHVDAAPAIFVHNHGRIGNSPAGLAAYVLEKFSSWTDMDHRGLSDGGLLRKFSMVDLLDNVMLYWTTNSITSAMRIYSEYFSRANQDMQWDRIPVHVPAFCAQFPKELLRMPEFILRAKYKNLFPRQFPARDDPLYQAVRPPRGGHFAAMEEARLLTYSVQAAAPRLSGVALARSSRGSSMSSTTRILCTLGFIIVARCTYQALYAVPPMPDIPETNYWGPGEFRPDDERIRPFRINISDQVLSDLNTRLSLELKLKPPLEGVNFEYGFNSNALRKIVDFWRNEYNWREREKKLNEMPQFITQVFGLNVHYIHAKRKDLPKGTKVLPLLLVHGWPGSIKEFHKIIPILTSPIKDADFVFEVIAPSLPGFASSEASYKPGLSPAHMAVMFRHLMKRLGHEKFYVQGGDWGAIIVANIATLFPDEVLGLHSNMCMVNSPIAALYLLTSSVYPSMFVDDELASKMYPLSKLFSDLMLESGYFHIQATKPDTVGVALSSSPAGLAAYILEKFSTATDLENRGLADGGLTRKFDLADLLDNVMLYWVSGSMTSAMRLYAETVNKKTLAEKWDELPVLPPSFCVQFPNEGLRRPDFILRLKYVNLYPREFPGPNDPLYPAVRPPRGGHFAAMEEPQLLADSLVQAVKLFRTLARYERTMIGRVVLTLLVFYLARAAYQSLYHVPPVPDYPETNYWGPGEAKPDDVTIKPFKINVAEDVLTDLNNRLDLELRIQPTLEGMGSEYGLNSGEVKRAVHFWRNLYNWTERQAMLNEMPQFTTQVFGLNLHFVHAKPKNVPKGTKMAIMFRHLMLRLGHEKFYVQGGMHSNMCASNSPASNLYLFISSFWPSLFVDSELASRLYPLSATFSNLMLESGYMHLQATKPDTVGVALNNSPAGLAAYILEKFSSWTDMEYRSRYDGGFTRTTFGVVDVLDNVMLYWVTGSITSSMRLYSEAFNKEYFAEKWDS
ncbi:hypothetical protein B566_EDAN004590 [Ephemera danica]|nr:hypothetical protein B566_EDAN004590 [Ephemera danica]